MINIFSLKGPWLMNSLPSILISPALSAVTGRRALPLLLPGRPAQHPLTAPRPTFSRARFSSLDPSNALQQHPNYWPIGCMMVSSEIGPSNALFRRRRPEKNAGTRARKITAVESGLNMRLSFFVVLGRSNDQVWWWLFQPTYKIQRL